MAGELFNVCSLLQLDLAPIPKGMAPVKLDGVSLIGTKAAAATATRADVLEVSNLDGLGLTVEWRVEKTIGPTPDIAEITVYNLAPENRTRLAVAASLPLGLLGLRSVQLYIGWGSSAQLLFAGQARRIRPARETGLDVLTDIEAIDGAVSLRDTPPGGTVEYGIGIARALALTLDEIGIPPGAGSIEMVQARAAALPVQQFQFAHVESPQARIDTLMAAVDLDWSIAGGFFVVYQAGVRVDLAPEQLMPETGLLSWEEAERGAVQFEALARPSLAPGGRVTILTGPLSATAPRMVGGGPLVVEQIEFRGSSNRESIMTGFARALTVTPAVTASKGLQVTA